MITTTLGKLSDSWQALSDVLEPRLPQKVAYHLTKLAGYVESELKIYNTKRNELIKELGEERPAKDGEGYGPITEVKKENWKAFSDGLKELQDVSVTISWNPMKLETYGVEISPRRLSILVDAGLFDISTFEESEKK